MVVAQFPITGTTAPKVKPDESKLGFGRIFTDHMFIMDYTEEKGWHDGRIVPYGDISLDPASVVLHYGQESFEGLKAYRTASGTVQLFRPDENAKRLNTTHNRMCMPPIGEDIFIAAVSQLVQLEKDWVPTSEGTSLYIRPFAIATEAFLGVHPSTQYKFMVICSPVGAYYDEGLAPIKIYVEDEYVRATPGGTGFVKCGGNYAAALKAQEKADALGCSQVLWLDGKERTYIEEVGSMNVFFKIDGQIYTSPADGTVLPGITRKSCMALLESWGIPVKETHYSIHDLTKAYADGKLEEVFGTGTAAVISPVGHLRYKDIDMEISDGQIGSVTQRLYDTLTGIQWGKLEDSLGWTVKL